MEWRSHNELRVMGAAGLDFSGLDGTALRPRARAEAAASSGGVLLDGKEVARFDLPLVEDLDQFERHAVDLVKVCAALLHAGVNSFTASGEVDLRIRGERLRGGWACAFSWPRRVDAGCSLLSQHRYGRNPTTEDTTARCTVPLGMHIATAVGRLFVARHNQATGGGRITGARKRERSRLESGWWQLHHEARGTARTS